MSTEEWVLDSVIGFNALLILGNWGVLHARFSAAPRNGRNSHYSFAPPFLAGVAASCAMLIHPRPGVYRFCWVPLALDPSIGFSLVYAALRKTVPWFRLGRKR